MEELKAIFASNLIKLRAEAGLTQAELGEKIHYSDKSISKWVLAEVFGVSVSALLTGEEEWRYIEKPEEKPVEYSRPTVISCTIAGIWTLCLVEFVLMWILGHVYWIILLAAVPITLVTLLVFNSVWYAGRRNMYIIGALVLSIALILALELRAWQILLLIPPAEIVVYLACHIRRREKQE